MLTFACVAITTLLLQVTAGLKALGATDDDANPRGTKHQSQAADSGSGAGPGAAAAGSAPPGRVRVWGTGKAVSKTVSVAEIIKQKVPGLKQETIISQVRQKRTRTHTPTPGRAAPLGRACPAALPPARVRHETRCTLSLCISASALVLAWFHVHYAA